MDFINTQLQDATIIKPEVHEDERGFFFEIWRQDLLDRELNQGKPLVFVQEYQNSSVQHVLRGLHFQPDKPMGKLMRTIRGDIFVVLVDLRSNSSTEGHYQGFYLTEENKFLLWIPPGFAHGFYTVSKRADLSCKYTDYYQPEHDQTIMWNDPDLAIKWPLQKHSKPKLSTRDSHGIGFSQAPRF